MLQVSEEEEDNTLAWALSTRFFGQSSWHDTWQVIQREPWEHIKDEDIRKAAASFCGEIWQVPPMFSAIKVSRVRPVLGQNAPKNGSCPGPAMAQATMRRMETPWALPGMIMHMKNGVC